MVCINLVLIGIDFGQQVALYLESASDSVAPEHLRGACQRGSIGCGTVGYRLQVPGECEERISASVAPEHLRGTW
jgi:hypothetical protein